MYFFYLFRRPVSLYYLVHRRPQIVNTLASSNTELHKAVLVGAILSFLSDSSVHYRGP